MTGHLLIQISDIHLMPNGELLHGVSPREHLLQVFATLDEHGVEPDVFVLTGDLADSGDPECYADLAQIMDDRARGATVVYLPGNHDRRAAFRQHLLRTTPSSEPVNQVHWHTDLRIVSLDSSVPEAEHGRLEEETLDFLADQLATPAPGGTIVAVHHPPIRSPILPMDRIRLLQRDEFAQAVTGTDVRLVICGHNHHEGLGSLGPVPVWVSPSSAYRLDVLSRDATQDRRGCAVSRIDVDQDGAAVSVIVVADDPVPPSSARPHLDPPGDPVGPGTD